MDIDMAIMVGLFRLRQRQGCFLCQRSGDSPLTIRVASRTSPSFEATLCLDCGLMPTDDVHRYRGWQPGSRGRKPTDPKCWECGLPAEQHEDGWAAKKAYWERLAEQVTLIVQAAIIDVAPLYASLHTQTLNTLSLNLPWWHRQIASEALLLWTLTRSVGFSAQAADPGSYGDAHNRWVTWVPLRGFVAGGDEEWCKLVAPFLPFPMLGLEKYAQDVWRKTECLVPAETLQEHLDNEDGEEDEG